MKALILLAFLLAGCKTYTPAAYNSDSVAIANPLFQPTEKLVVGSGPGSIAGDPFIVKDGAVFRMFYFRASPSGVATYSKTATNLTGPWGDEAATTGLSGFHKFVMLVDESGAPVLVNGQYHGYAVSFDAGRKSVWHFTADAIGGPWQKQSEVLPAGPSGYYDGRNTDAPYAIYSNGTIMLWYMAEPDTDQLDYGFASRMLRAESSDPDTGFVRDYTPVMNPGEGWKYGWIGGMQIIANPSGGYVMIYNAGNTRPGPGGGEPDTSMIGMAYAPSLDGPWTDSQPGPIVGATSPQGLENTDIWRGHFAYDGAKWLLFYNTGSSATTGEQITYAVFSGSTL